MPAKPPPPPSVYQLAERVVIARRAVHAARAALALQAAALAELEAPLLGALTSGGPKGFTTAEGVQVGLRKVHRLKLPPRTEPGKRRRAIEALRKAGGELLVEETVAADKFHAFWRNVEKAGGDLPKVIAEKAETTYRLKIRDPNAKADEAAGDDEAEEAAE